MTTFLFSSNNNGKNERTDLVVQIELSEFQRGNGGSIGRERERDEQKNRDGNILKTGTLLKRSLLKPYRSNRTRKAVV